MGLRKAFHHKTGKLTDPNPQAEIRLDPMPGQLDLIKIPVVTERLMFLRKKHFGYLLRIVDLPDYQKRPSLSPMKWGILMQDIRKSPEYQRWKREVRQRDGDACRICGVHLNLHIHHIKPLEKYPDFATEFDNGITLCGNSCSFERERRKHQSTIIEAVTKKPRIANQLKELNDKFCAYLEPLLKSSDPNIRNNAFYQLVPDSLDQFLPLIQHLLDSNGPDEGLAKQIAIEFLKGNSSGAASQFLAQPKAKGGGGSGN